MQICLYETHGKLDSHLTGHIFFNPYVGRKLKYPPLSKIREKILLKAKGQELYPLLVTFKDRTNKWF